MTIIGGTNIDADNHYRDIVGKIDDIKDYEDELIQFFGSNAVKKERIPFTEDPKYNESISAEIYDILIHLKVFLPYEW